MDNDQDLSIFELLQDETIVRYTFVECNLREIHLDLNIRDIMSLAPEASLTDQVLDFALNYTFQRMEDHVQDSVLLFGTTFYGSWSNRRALQINVKGNRWIKNIPNIRKKMFWVFPLLVEGHWLLTIVYNPIGAIVPKSSVEEELISDSSNKEQVGFLLLFDSQLKYLRLKREELLENVREFLHAQIKVLCNDQEMFDSDLLNFIVPKVPQQSNEFDCGSFVVSFFELFFNYTVSEWFKKFDKLPESWRQNFVAMTEMRKRDEIYQQILKLCRQKGSEFTSCLPDCSSLLSRLKDVSNNNNNNEEKEEQLKLAHSHNNTFDLIPNASTAQEPPSTTSELDSLTSPFKSTIRVVLQDEEEILIRVLRFRSVKIIRKTVCRFYPQYINIPFRILLANDDKSIQRVQLDESELFAELEIPGTFFIIQKS